ncbi:MAG TPA: hydrogenase [Chloroflexota bacterium]|nr:hydrogenase [Chloroflexota bacterium]
MPVHAPSVASQILQILGVGLVLTAFWMLAARRLADYLNAYAAQSIAVALVAAVVGAFTGRLELYAVAVLTILVKVVAITGILRSVARRLPIQREVRPSLNLPTSLLIGVGLVLLAFLTSPSVVAPGTFLNEPPLAVSLTLVLMGLFLISSRRHVLAQVVGLLTIENGLFSGAIAIAYGMPFIVEFGILFDVLVAVIVLGLLVTMIQHHIVTADTAELRRLRG